MIMMAMKIHLTTMITTIIIAPPPCIPTRLSNQHGGHTTLSIQTNQYKRKKKFNNAYPSSDQNMSAFHDYFQFLGSQ